MKKQKQAITGNNLSMICLHAPHHVEEKTYVHQSRRRLVRFDLREASHAPPWWSERRPLARACERMLATFRKKIEKTTWKILKRLHAPLNYTPYPSKFYCCNPQLYVSWVWQSCQTQTNSKQTEANSKQIEDNWLSDSSKQ